MRWLYAVLVLIFAYIFMTIQPLDNIPSVIYSYIWLFVVILGTINFLLGSNIYNALRGGLSLLVIGFHVGVTIGFVQWSGFSVSLIRELVFASSPVFLYIESVRKIIRDLRLS